MKFAIWEIISAAIFFFFALFDILYEKDVYGFWDKLMLTALALHSVALYFCVGRYFDEDEKYNKKISFLLGLPSFLMFYLYIDIYNKELLSLQNTVGAFSIITIVVWTIAEISFYKNRK